MILSSLAGLDVLQSPLLAGLTGVQHLFTLRGAADAPTAPASAATPHADPYASLNLCDYTGDTPAHVRAGRRRVADALGVPVARLWFPRQVHGTAIAVVDAATPQGLEADAVITREAGLCIGVNTADCVPVLLYDPVARAVAAVHAGWRGTVRHIVALAVARMQQVAGTRPADLYAALGPSISPQAFEVGEEVAEAFRAAGRAACILHPQKPQPIQTIQTTPTTPTTPPPLPKPHIDLWQANAMDLLDAGVPLDHIDCTPVCSYTHPDLVFSARRLGIGSGRTASCIALHNPA